MFIHEEELFRSELAAIEAEALAEELEFLDALEELEEQIAA